MLLAIDTSGNQTSVALIASAELSLKSTNVESSAVQGNSHSVSLASLVARVLSENNISEKQLSGIVLGAGPGSFTGLRIGFAFAKGLALALALPISTFSSLHAAAWQFRNKSRLILAIDDARRNEYFAASFIANEQSFDRATEDKIITNEDLINWQNDNPSGLMISANNLLLERFPKLEIAINLASSLGQLALIDMAKSPASRKENYVSEIAQISPTYIRAVSARSILEREKAQ